MKIFKKVLSLLLVLVMVLGLLPTSAFADNGEYVYLSVSFDGQYINDQYGTPITYIPVSLSDIQSIDLAAYDLDNMLFDADGDGQYETTALQLLIYAHEEIYGGDWSEVIFDALPGSSYFKDGIFGFTENLVYFLNGDFPIDESQSGGWYTVGATSDRIVLEAGDFIDVASFNCFSFLWDMAGGFHLFADPEGNYVHDYVTDVGEALPIKLKHSFCDLMYGEAWVYDATDYDVYYGKTMGQPDGIVTTDGEGNAEITFTEPGTYFVWCDGDQGSDDGTHSGCDHYSETGEPCYVSSPAYAKVTVNETAKIAAVGDQYFTSLDAAFAYQAESGAEYVSLIADLTAGDVLLPAKGVLNLNGYALTADTFDSIAGGAKVIDTTGGDGLLFVKGACAFSPSNPQLPIKDTTAGGFRFFAAEVASVAATGKNSTCPKYWFSVKFENFEKVYALIQSGSELALQVLLTVNEKEVTATASRDFLLKWADAYKANSGSYITATLLDSEQNALSVVPAISANGVCISGNAF